MKRGDCGRTATVALLVGALGCPSVAFAYRPFNSTDAAVAATGEMEIEVGPAGFVNEGADASLVVPSVIFNWGFARRMELVLEGRHFIRVGSVPVEQPRFRIEETALSLKRVLREGTLQQKPGISLATEVGALLPTVNGEAGVGAQGTIIASQRWTDLTVHLNAAVAWTRADSLGLFGGMIVEGHDAWAVRPVAEVFVESEQNLPTAVSGLVGGIWRATDNLSFDAALRIARAGDVTTTEVRAGLTWAFSLGFPRRSS